METAVLFLIFNRPDSTRKVFESIRAAKPQRMYVASDGPRSDRAGEDLLCAEAREIIDEVDWECDVETYFRDTNLGCRVAVSTAIDWFFENEPQGIIIEDDCLPDQSFYRFCEDLLDRYRDDPRVMLVSGDYFHGSANRPDSSYYFSHYNHCWGWASWRRAWRLYDRNMDQWPKLRDTDWLLEVGDGHADFRQYWRKQFDRSYAGEIDSWAYRWLFSCWVNDGLTALPGFNLVKNIGFSDQATHTRNTRKWADLPLESISFPLCEPGEVVRDKNLDRLTDLYVVGTKKPYHRKLLSSLRDIKRVTEKMILSRE